MKTLDEPRSIPSKKTTVFLIHIISYVISYTPSIATDARGNKYEFVLANAYAVFSFLPPSFPTSDILLCAMHGRRRNAASWKSDEFGR